MLLFYYVIAYSVRKQEIERWKCINSNDHIVQLSKIFIEKFLSVQQAQALLNAYK